jgi:hypothetical protein
MSGLDNISHLYKGLILRNRAFASFREDERNTIYSNLLESGIEEDVQIFDPMSGYGGTMSFFGSKGYSTYNVEINPPAYYWQLLINPLNKQAFIEAIDYLLVNIGRLPNIAGKFSITDEFFDEEAINHIEKLYKYFLEILAERELAIALLLPFVARFANYQKSATNITHFKQGGLCSFEGWENDFIDYLNALRNRIEKINNNQINHTSILSNIFDVPNGLNFRCFVTSPPYPNYRDYSKIFKIENWILDNIINETKSDFNSMIGSDVVRGKKYGAIESDTANKFLKELLDKSKKLSKKSRTDIEVYYYPYFALYFYNIQEAYRKVNEMLSDDAIGYIVVNNNITRDIEVPVGKSICEFFVSMGYNISIIDESEIAHFGNIRKKAKRINSRHVRHIVKVWKK